MINFYIVSLKFRLYLSLW